MYDTFGPWHMWGAPGFGWIFPLLMMVFMIVLCLFMMSRMHWSRGHSARDQSASALDILSERFAKGEIPKEEFEDKRKTLLRRP